MGTGTLPNIKLVLSTLSQDLLPYLELYVLSRLTFASQATKSNIAGFQQLVYTDSTVQQYRQAPSFSKGEENKTEHKYNN